MATTKIILKKSVNNLGHAGDIVEAEIISVDAARGRIGLSMKKVKK